MNKTELEQQLKSKGIPIEKWGVGESKTLENLLHELESGDSRLEEDPDLGVLRVEAGVGINVYFNEGKNSLVLVEDRQVFKDGRIRRRNLPTSIGEKMRPGESPLEAVSRAFSEELNIVAIGVIFSIGEEDRQPVSSVSFPGLWTKRKIHVFDTTMPPEYFKPEGYVEEQEDKTNYYEWRVVPVCSQKSPLGG